jgi:hypothetical protein
MSDKSKNNDNNNDDPGESGRDLTEAEAEKLTKNVIFKPDPKGNGDNKK